MYRAPPPTSLRHPADILSEPAAAGDRTESWVITYLDVITLMLVFFVVLLALSNFNVKASAAESEPVTEPAPPAPGAEPVTTRPGWTLPESVDGVELVVDEDRVSFIIGDQLLFRSGEATLTADGLELLQALYPPLAGSDQPISVEGHTDNVPIANAPFPSNWELSAARAASVLRQLIELGLQPERLRAIGYAETRPIAGNDSIEGRARNRRVGLILHLDPDADQLRPVQAPPN